MSETLGRLKTDLGERSTYDAASQCSRCGYCEQACPTYVATGHESKSPRGRNQLLRLMLEGKLSDPKTAEEAFATCLLCGACSTACYAHVSVPDLVLEGRRMLREKPHWLTRTATRLLVDRPGLFAFILKTAHLLKKLGLSRLGRPFLSKLGLHGLAEADKHVKDVPLTFLSGLLKTKPKVAAPEWLYFAPCGPNFLYPKVGQATVAVLDELKGPGNSLDNGCCGLLPYNYGEVSDARALAKRVIEDAEASGEIPVVADCSSCAAFLKTYPQLFLDDIAWKERSERFASRVQDAVQALGDASDKLPAVASTERTTYHDSCRACHGQGLRAEPRKAMKKLSGESFKELPESDVCCGGAGAFSFVQPELSDEVLRRKIGCIAASQAALVVTSSTSCLVQLAHGLKKYYPEGRVMHLSEYAAEALARQKKHGTPTGA